LKPPVENNREGDKTMATFTTNIPEREEPCRATMREHVLRMADWVTDEEIPEAIRESHLHSLILELVELQREPYVEMPILFTRLYDLQLIGALDEEEGTADFEAFAEAWHTLDAAEKKEFLQYYKTLFNLVNVLEAKIYKLKPAYEAAVEKLYEADELAATRN
jgi:hypothetical protein